MGVCRDTGDKGVWDMTDEDRVEIKNMIEIAKQECMLMLPEVAASLYMQSMAKMKAIGEFMEKNKDLAEHIDMLRKQVEEIDAKSPGTEYSKILEDASITVREKIKKIKELGVKEVDKPKDLVYQDFGQI